MLVRMTVLILMAFLISSLSFAGGSKPKTKQIIHSIFKGALFRAPKADGEKYWREAIEKDGMAGVISLAGTIGVSDEFQRKCKEHDNESHARNLFFHIYGREPTVEELEDDVVPSLKQHGSKEQFLKDFVNTYEFKERFFY